MNKPQPKVIVGIPVYNGEEFIHRAIDSVLSQTFVDFEIIISDNASTDSTSDICNEYVKKDNRIKYISQKENNGGMWNFLFLLGFAKSDYFVWLAADDYWSPDFLEKNVNILESDKKIVASVGKIEPFGENYDEFKNDHSDKTIEKNYKKIRRHYRPHHYHSVSGSYEKRIGSCLKHSTYYLFFYALFRTEILFKGFELIWDEKKFGKFDTHTFVKQKGLGEWAEEHIFARQLPLISLRFGGIHVVDEIMSYRYTAGTSGKNKNIITEYLQGEIGLKNMFFSKIPFIKWCWRSLGKKVFLKNMYYFTKLGLGNTNFVGISLIRYLIGQR